MAEQTTTLNIEKPGTHGQQYPRIADALEEFDKAVAQRLALTLSGTSTTLTEAQGRHAVIVLSGSPGGAATLTVPAFTGKQYLVINNSDQAVTVKMATGTGVAIAAGGSAALFNNGTNVTETYATAAALAAAVLGLWDDKGNTDCSANPNYPSASKGDCYTVSVAGKIGGASGVTVEAGDVFRALADNAGGTQAGVGSSWAIVQSNLDGTLLPSSDEKAALAGHGESPATSNRFLTKLFSNGASKTLFRFGCGADTGTPSADGVRDNYYTSGDAPDGVEGMVREACDGNSASNDNQVGFRLTGSGGAHNNWLLVRNGFSWAKKYFRIGDGTNANQTLLEAHTGASDGAKPVIRLNYTTGLLEYAPDGVNFQGMGAGEVCVASSISSNQTDYEPTGTGNIRNLEMIKQPLTADATIYSLSPGYDGQIIVIYNGSSAYTLTLAHSYSTGTTAAWRFSFDSVDLKIKSGAGQAIIYDGASSRWRRFGGTLSGTVGTTDNAVVRADGTGGVTTQNSVMVIADAGDVYLPDQTEPGTTTNRLYWVSAALKAAGKFLSRWNGDVPAAAGIVTVNSSGLLTSTDNDGNTAHFWRGDGAWATPSGGGGGSFDERDAWIFG